MIEISINWCMERGHMNLHRHHCHFIMQLWFFLSGFPLLTYMGGGGGGALIMDTFFFQLVNFILKIVKLTKIVSPFDRGASFL